MASNPSTLINTDTIIRLGYIVQVINGQDNLTLTQVADTLLKRQDESYYSSRFASYLPDDTDIPALLGNITAVVPTLPHEDPSKRHTASYLAMYALTVPFVIMRIYARKYISPKRLLSEDWWCIIALMMCAVQTGAIAPWMTMPDIYGAGKHQYDLTLGQIRNMNKLFMIIQFIFILTHLPVKMTFLMFYYRVFPNSMFRKLVVFMAVYFTLFTLGSIPVIALQCRPVAYWAGTNLVTAKCLPRTAIFTLNSTSMMLTDLTILVLPIREVWKLSLRLRDKILLVGVFGAGGLITVSSIIRLIYLVEWLTNADYSYPAAAHSFWILFELDLSVIISCAPALKVLFAHRTPNFQKSIPGMSKMGWTRHGMFKGALAARQKEIEMLPKSGTGSESSTDWSDNRTSEMASRVTTVITAEVHSANDTRRNMGRGLMSVGARDTSDDHL